MRFNPKEISQQLEAGQFWPVYWLVGPEDLKARELAHRIETTLTEERINPFQTQRFDGREVSAVEIIETAQAIPLGGGIPIVWVRHADQLKQVELLESLYGSNTTREKLPFICILRAESWDRRRKWCSAAEKKTAWISCEAVNDADRPVWVEFLAKRAEVTLSPTEVTFLRSLEPWSLDRVQSEIEKKSIDPSVTLDGDEAHVLSTDAFLEAFFTRNIPELQKAARTLAEHPEHSIPLLGLLAWNVRTLVLYQSRQAPKLHPKVEARFRVWASHAPASHWIRVSHLLADLDLHSKHSPLSSLGLWGTLFSQL